LQMQAIGLEVSRVIVFDTLAPGYPKPMPFLKRLTEHFKSFRQLQGREKIDYLKQRGDHVRKRLLYTLNLHRFYAPNIPGVNVVPQETLRKVWGNLYKAREAYMPHKPFDGKVVLVSSEQTVQWIGHKYDDPNKGWDRWALQGVQLYMVPAAHMAFFHDDNIELLSSQMREVLREVAIEVKSPRV
jgi:thioesterase domain-containing protein